MFYKSSSTKASRFFPLLLITVMALIFSSFTAYALPSKKQKGSEIQPDNYYPRVLFETTMGNITIELNRRKAPITVNNFLRYVNYEEYDNTLFQRIIPNYIVQGGGYSPDFKVKTTFSSIFNESGNGLKNRMYSIAMARKDDPHSAIRQFFFNVSDNTNLDPGRGWGYTVFGEIIDGTDVVDKMSEVETEYNVQSGFRDVPVNPIILNKATILPEIK
ncbi:peptidylprolyl isomerase [Agaribacter marinus]|uniref:Peptidyl-prolyl cis-trans isomerase n=1 Tax=Agaribacter marinus TaxID=1431249 RepID=A0AA37T463_9ALTE|nr:peptidyl-prolyl cis-trans isomerase [Agaribacter marinus]